MKRNLSVLLGIVLFIAGCHYRGFAGGEGVAPRISQEEAKTLLDGTTAVFLDARTASSWDGSDRKIKGAVRVDPRDVRSWAGRYPKDRTLVVYCS